MNIQFLDRVPDGAFSVVVMLVMSILLALCVLLIVVSIWVATAVQKALVKVKRKYAYMPTIGADFEDENEDEVPKKKSRREKQEEKKQNQAEFSRHLINKEKIKSYVLKELGKPEGYVDVYVKFLHDNRYRANVLALRKIPPSKELRNSIVDSFFVEVFESSLTITDFSTKPLISHKYKSCTKAESISDEVASSPDKSD